MSKNLVIVESPAKAKTIEKYLGSDFHVLSSVGHIRTDTKVDVNDDFKVTYEIDPKHKKVVAELKKAAKSATTIWLATDEDREGESISWHLAEVLNLPKSTHRITFHEITKSALEHAIQNPRTIDMAMVASQQARQTLDMLVGFDLSGVVRRKVPGAISAGRVQSPALRLIVEREREIDAFATNSTFKITGHFLPTPKTEQKPNKTTPIPSLASEKTPQSSPEQKPNTTPQAQPTDPFPATLDKFTPKTPDETTSLLESLKNLDYLVQSVDETSGTKSAPTPFSTATLQIEANAKLGFSSKTTMSAAQGLYQAGHITYHRTDSLNLSEQALKSIASHIQATYGAPYLHTRRFKTKSASAQEAHEAIRPTNITQEVAGKTSYEQKLYQLIRSRTLASQMSPAKIAKTTIKLTPLPAQPSAKNLQPSTQNPSHLNHPSPTTTPHPTSNTSLPKNLTFTAKGEVIVFDGFLKVYGKSKDTTLPKLSVNDVIPADRITARQTFAKPPARYTEGSLVKKLEELGIGRPSTYASIMEALQKRAYVTKGNSEGTPRDVLEITLINRPAPQITTQTVQEKSGADKGKLLPTPSGELLSDFLLDHFNQVVDYNFTASVEEKLDQIAEKKLQRVKMLSDFYRPFSQLITASEGVNRYNAARELGLDPTTKKPIFAKIGKNGGFIQLGANEKASGEKPRFAPLPTGTTTKTVTLAQAIAQLTLPALPRTLGMTKDGTELIAASGPFGPYLKAGKYNIPIKNHDPYTISLDAATALYDAKKASIIADWGDISIINGAYGPYIKGPGRLNNLKIKKDLDPTTITETMAKDLLLQAGKPITKPTKTKASSKKPTKTKKSPKKPTKSTKPAKSTKSTSKSKKPKS